MEPLTAPGSGDVVKIDGIAMTVWLNCFELEPLTLVTVAVKLNTPDAVGVPLTLPVEESKERPGGSAPLVTLHARGAVPVAVKIWA